MNGITIDGQFIDSLNYELFRDKLWDYFDTFNNMDSSFFSCGHMQDFHIDLPEEKEIDRLFHDSHNKDNTLHSVSTFHLKNELDYEENLNDIQGEILSALDYNDNYKKILDWLCADRNDYRNNEKKDETYYNLILTVDMKEKIGDGFTTDCIAKDTSVLKIVLEKVNPKEVDAPLNFVIKTCYPDINHPSATKKEIQPDIMKVRNIDNYLTPVEKLYFSLKQKGKEVSLLDDKTIDYYYKIDDVKYRARYNSWDSEIRYYKQDENCKFKKVSLSDSIFSDNPDKHILSFIKETQKMEKTLNKEFQRNNDIFR